MVSTTKATKKPASTKTKTTKVTAVTDIAPDEIQVPDLRVTSQVDPHIVDEIMASIQKVGILQPLHVAKVGENYVLEDGLHRLLAAKTLDLKSVPCIVHQATEGEVLVRNLVLNRQRGKSNPADEAKVIRYLAEEEGKEMDEVMALTGLSEQWARRLYNVSKLPDEVQNLLQQGLITVSGASHLVKLQDPDLQIGVARDAATWRYTEEQVKIRVADLLGTREEPKPGEIAFANDAKPIIIPLTCYLCHKEVPRGDNYIWLCEEDRILIDQFYAAYLESGGGQAAPAEAPPSKKLVLTDKGWVVAGL